MTGMSRRYRPFAALVLACLLVLTAQSMAVARGMPGAAGSIVLCTGTGPVTILTDAEGQPIAPAHVCPDCTLSLIVAVAQAVPDAVRPQGRADAVILPAARPALLRGSYPFSARDPPAQA